MLLEHGNCHIQLPYLKINPMQAIYQKYPDKKLQPRQ